MHAHTVRDIDRKLILIYVPFSGTDVYDRLVTFSRLPGTNCALSESPFTRDCACECQCQQQKLFQAVHRRRRVRASKFISTNFRCISGQRLD